MAAAVDNPTYTVYIVDGNYKYNITPALIELDMSNQERQVAQSVDLTVVNTKTSTGKTICDILDVRRRVFIYANDGSKKEEVFRGWTWTRYHQSTEDERVLKVKCYDNLIYLQESEDSLYYSKGKNTKSVVSDICKKWGITLNYSYSTITHPKLVLKGSLTDIFISDILNAVKKRTGEKYAITSQKDVMYIAPVGSNSKIYKILTKENAVDVKAEKTMDGMVTKVKILGNAKKSGKVPVEATVTGDTSKYGTLQKLITKDSDDSLSDAKKEANAIIQESGAPDEEFYVTAPDIPWIKKGDMVYVDAGHIDKKYLVVAGIERNISNKKKTMTLTLEKQKDKKISTSVKTASKGSSSSGSGSTPKTTTGKASEDLLVYAKEVFAEITRLNFKYQGSGCASSYAKAKKERKADCSHYVCYCLQEMGLIKPGETFWCGGRQIHYRGGISARKLSKIATISSPNKSPRDAKLQPGDICGYTTHTQIFAGWDKKGNALWYSFGPTDVNRKLPRKRGNYNTRKIENLIRLK